MSISTTTVDRDLWLNASKARTRGGLTPASLNGLAMAGQIRTRALPGLPIRFNAEDCDRIRKEMSAAPISA